jgi:two-component system sensor histidine kinase/response regulator
MLVMPVSASTLVDSLIADHERDCKRAPPARRLEEHPALRGARVLLVEDNELNQEIADEILPQAGVSVTIAANGSERPRGDQSGDRRGL